ncbi:MAG: helix-turn-helix transcriptional regulator [Rhizobiales bacterium]|nr:helix-turn-helix transcriptional regulator [Hyphomicrobiales bacterium]
MEAHKRLARNLQRMRRERGLSQEALADRAQMHQTYLSGLESGKRNPSLAVLSRLADALEIDLSELLAPT